MELTCSKQFAFLAVSTHEEEERVFVTQVKVSSEVAEQHAGCHVDRNEHSGKVIPTFRWPKPPVQPCRLGREGLGLCHGGQP